jgi:hypothetical protein
MSIEITAGQHALLSRMRNGMLGSLGPDGTPHLAPVWYLWDGEVVRVSTVRTAAKVRDSGATRGSRSASTTRWPASTSPCTGLPRSLTTSG